MSKEILLVKGNINFAKSDCPIPLELIPNNMGISLNSVHSVEWEKTDDGQLLNLCIKFIPDA